MSGLTGDPAVLSGIAKDVATVVVLFACTAVVIAILLMMVYVWHYALAAAVVAVAVLAFRRRSVRSGARQDAPARHGVRSPRP